jgi:ADP-ribose pyrophosphatase
LAVRCDVSNHLPNDSPRVARHLIHKGRKFSFEQVTVTGTDGKTLTHDLVRHPGAVVIVPILDGHQGPEVVLIRNWRPSVERWVWELPAGTMEPGEEPETCAGRELEEETGYAAATIRYLTRFYTSPGLSDELMWAYAAHGLTPVGQRLEADERVTVHPTPALQVLKMIDSGELADGKSIAGVLMAHSRGMFA